MQQYIGITVPDRSFVMRDTDPSDPKRTAFGQLVKINPGPNAK
jgi:hypothetical protein